MRRRRALPAGLALSCLLVMIVCMTPAGGTRSAWYEEDDTRALPATADRFTLSFDTIADNSESSDPHDPAVWNQPGIDVHNDSSTLTRTVALRQTRLSNRYRYADQQVDVLLHSSIVYTLAPEGQECQAGEGTRLWEVKKDAVPVAQDGIYSAPPSASFELRPGQTRRICFTAIPNEDTTTPNGRRALLHRFAGGGIRAETSITADPRLTSGPGDAVSATTHSRVALPLPQPDPSVMDSSGRVAGCARAGSTVTHGYARLAWIWPSPGISLHDERPSAIRRWELWTREPGHEWARVTSGNDLRSGDWTNAPRYDGGLIPPDVREVFIERGHIRSPGFDGRTATRDYIVVGVLNTDAETRFVAAHAWEISWNGHVASFLNEHECVRSVTAPPDVTGRPNVPGKEW